MAMEMVQGWFHAEVGFEEFVQHVCAFLDMLVLASGYQSDGSPAMWTPGTLRKALDWACYLEEVFDSLPAGSRGEESKNRLNARLEMLFKKEPLPPGMTKVSSAELEKARSLLVQVLMQALPAETAWLTASVIQTGEDVELKEIATRAISQRCMAKGCVKSLQLASDVTAESCTNRRQRDAKGIDIWQTPQSTPEFKSHEFEKLVNEGLIFVTSAETIHKLSGACLIFSGGRTHWFQAFESLLTRPNNGLTSVRGEIAELCCFFLASPKWKTLPRKIVPSSCMHSMDLVSFGNSWLGKEATPRRGNGEYCTRESREVEAYLKQLLALEKDLWLQLHPILLAVALSESSLLDEYVRYIGDSMLEHPGECSGKCTCDICRRRKDARERSWWLLMIHQRAGVNIQTVKDLSCSCSCWFGGSLGSARRR